jgi:MFS family permease
VILKSLENLAKLGEIVSAKSSTSVSGESSSSSEKRFNYSYIVLVGSFIAYMLASLLSTCFGVFFENMESDLGWSKSKVAFIGGLISALQDLTGPISSALTNRFGCRKTAFFGGLIAALGMIASGYVQDFWLVGFLMGGVSGFGSSLVLVSSVVVVTYYFEEKPSFAAGLTISGGSLGQSIFSLIIIKLNELYGRSGCFLILGGKK